MLYPGAMDQATFFPLPKKHSRRPDTHWDHITKGADIQSAWVENQNGDREREIDGKLETFDLRTKKVDPTSLGVDPGVQQYSGYLDDNKNDKHLFYCKSLLCAASIVKVAYHLCQGSLSLEMILRMIQSSFGSMGDLDAVP